MSIQNKAIEASLGDDADEIKQAAIEALKGLYRVQLTVLDSVRQCTDPIEYAEAMQAINNIINVALTEVDIALGKHSTTPLIDHTDLEQDRAFNASADIIGAGGRLS